MPAGSHRGPGRLRVSAFAAAVLALAVTGCGLGSAGDDPADGPAWLIVTNAGEGAELSVDGVGMGPAAAYDGRDGTLELPAGAHAVVVTRGGQTVLRETITLSEGETSTLAVP
jgi:hypothetical protein